MLSGPDGSGKTFAAKRLQEALSESGFTTEYHWQRLGSSPFLELLKRPLGPRREPSAVDRGPTRSAQTDESHVLRRHPALDRVWSGVVALDYVARLWLIVVRARIKGGIHLFDRFAVDAAVDLRAMYGSRFSSMILKASPHPNVSILILPPGESEETGAGDYARYQNRFDAILVRPRVGDIDLNQILENLREAV
ncbi:MAG: hypothetical protein M3290_02790 [Actinomycetota bacterium]|nr:hypothetical protein [Actinomycetota bacterium]